MSTFLIIEGVDGSGKSTLAARLCDQYDAHYMHVGPPNPTKTPLGEYLDYLADVEQYERVVFDRFHLGCFAYGKVFRPHQDTDGIGDFLRTDWLLFERQLVSRSFLVLADPGWDAVFDEWETRRMLTEITGKERQFSEYEKSSFKLAQVYDYFKAAYEFSTLDKTTYDYREEDAWEKICMECESLGWSTT